MALPTAAEVITAYIATRDELEAKGKEFEVSIKELRDKQVLREKYLDSILSSQGLQNLSAPGAGTAFYKKHEHTSIENYDLFVEENLLKPAAEALLNMIEDPGQDPVSQYVNVMREAMKLEYLTNALSKTVVLEAMGLKRELPPPAGVKYSAQQVVQVRKN